MNLRALSYALLAALALVGATPAVSYAADDKCIETCDEEADACMSDAGDDEKKQKSCDEKYEACTAKCG